MLCIGFKGVWRRRSGISFYHETLRFYKFIIHNRINAFSDILGIEINDIA
jgi:hypothetical protein